MKKYLIVLLFAFAVNSLSAQITIASWNLENFGKSKPDVVINFVANTLKDFDIIAIQEVVAGYGGAQAVARLADELDRKGAKWDYRISVSVHNSWVKFPKPPDIISNGAHPCKYNWAALSATLRS